MTRSPFADHLHGGGSMVDIADIVIPDHLSSEDEAHAGILLGHLKDSAVRLDEAIQSAANWPSSDPGRGNRARTEALILLEGLRSLGVWVTGES
jgi:hypothetical protein